MSLTNIITPDEYVEIYRNKTQSYTTLRSLVLEPTLAVQEKWFDLVNLILKDKDLSEQTKSKLLGQFLLTNNVTAVGNKEPDLIIINENVSPHHKIKFLNTLISALPYTTITKLEIERTMDDHTMEVNIPKNIEKLTEILPKTHITQLKIVRQTWNRTKTNHLASSMQHLFSALPTTKLQSLSFTRSFLSITAMQALALALPLSPNLTSLDLSHSTPIDSVDNPNYNTKSCISARSVPNGAEYIKNLIQLSSLKHINLTRFFRMHHNYNIFEGLEQGVIGSQLETLVLTSEKEFYSSDDPNYQQLVLPALNFNRSFRNDYIVERFNIINDCLNISGVTNLVEGYLDFEGFRIDALNYKASAAKKVTRENFLKLRLGLIIENLEYVKYIGELIEEYLSDDIEFNIDKLYAYERTLSPITNLFSESTKNAKGKEPPSEDHRLLSIKPREMDRAEPYMLPAFRSKNKKHKTQCEVLLSSACKRVRKYFYPN